jgi:ribosomal protein S18 acetylase RimI-like enzyme
MQKVSIRWLIRRDMPAVLKLQESLEFPWEEADFFDALGNSNCIGMAADANGTVVGYMIYELYREYFYIEHLAVRADLRRQKIGTQLVGLLLDRLNPQRRTCINTNVRESDLPTQLFFKNLDFRATLIRDYYETEDSYYFKHRLKEEHGDI